MNARARIAAPRVLIALALAAALALVPALALATAPTVTIDPASSVGYASAHASGTVNPADKDITSCHFDYIDDAKYQFWVTEAGPEFGFFFAAEVPCDIPLSELTAGAGSKAVGADLIGLKSGTVYHLRLVAKNADGTTEAMAATFETAAVTPPVVTVDPASAVTDTSAHFSGTVEPGNADPAFDSICHFDYVAETDFESAKEGGFAKAKSVDCDINPVSGAGATSVQADATELLPHTVYHLRLRAENLGGPGIAEATETFGEPVAPTIVKQFPFAVATTSAILNARINPGGAKTSYHFEYVDQASFEASGFSSAISVPSPEAITPTTISDLVVSRTVFGLEPSTTYRFRVVASNTVGGAVGDPQAITTFAAPADAQAGVFPGQGFLPDNRAWEMVSPPGKAGTDVLADSTRVRVAADGGAVAFDTIQAFGDSQGNFITSSYLAQRGAERWGTHGITPPGEPLTINDAGLRQQPGFSIFTPDLSKGIYLSKSPLTDAPNVANLLRHLYLSENLHTPGASDYTLLSDATTLQPIPSSVFVGARNDPWVAGATPDFNHILFESWGNLTDDAVAAELPFGPKLYEWVNGAVRLVGILPASEGGGPAPSSRAGRGASAPGVYRTERTITADGSRVVFTDPTQGGASFRENGALYLRDDHGTASPLDDTTVPIAGVPGATERAEPDPEGVRPAEFWTASTGVEAGGTRQPLQVFFTSAEKLTDDDEDNSSDLYRWSEQADSGGHHLTRISVDQEPADGAGPVLGAIGASEDGSYVYFIALGGQRAAGGSVADVHGQGIEPGNARIFLWHDGVIRQVAGINHGEEPFIEPSEARYILGAAEWSKGEDNARLTPDGTHLAFVTSGTDQLTGYDHDGNPQCVGAFDVGPPCAEVYVYDAAADGGAGHLSCASCNPTGAAGSRDADIGAAQGKRGSAGYTQYRNRAISRDGRYVFFSTAERLVSEDTNGVSDAYLYDTRTHEQRLLSSGEDESPSYFVDASADGSDAVITTREQLSAWDTDRAMDLYDARIDGGLPEPPPPPPACQGDACQPLARVLNDPTPGSSTLSGPGDQRQPRKYRCPKGKRRVVGATRKPRCVKNRHRAVAKDSKRAHNHRGGIR